MYAETGLLFPYFQNFSQEAQHQLDFCHAPTTNASMTSSISSYNLGGEGDLFKAPEPIIEQPVVSLDPMTTAISIITSGEPIISPQALKVADIESIRSEQFLSEVFYECEKDLLAQDAMEAPLSGVLETKTPIARLDENLFTQEKLVPQAPLQKSVSSGCLSSIEWVHRASVRPTFLEFSGIDFGADYGMRRSFSEGDIKTLDNNGVSLVHSSPGQQQIISSYASEDRKQKLSRYRSKKSKRNFGRKIKYACRKALADSQPRIRGRFAKTEESYNSKKQ